MIRRPPRSTGTDTLLPYTPLFRARRRGLIELAEKGQFKGVTPRLLPLFIHEARLDDQAMPGTVTAMAERVGRDAFIRQQQAIQGRRDHGATLVGIRVLTLVLCGRQDALTPLADPQAMASAIADARLVGVVRKITRPNATHQR